jgi:hypothetical protein
MTRLAEVAETLRHAGCQICLIEILMRAQFMDELREIHLGHPARPVTGQRVTERLASAYSSLSPE